MGEDPGLWKTFFAAALTVISGLLGLCWSMLNGKIGEVNARSEAALPRSEFDAHLATVQESRKNNRDDFRHLFDNQAALREQVNTKVGDAVSRVEARLENLSQALRKDFNDGLKSIREEIRDRK